MNTAAGQIYILSGARGVGKTTTCQRLAAITRARELDLSGLICPARFEGGTKVGIELVDLRSGERRDLAAADSEPAPLRTDKYRFDGAAMAWGSQLIDAATPCALLIIDELGPLELIHRQGWVSALDVLRAGRFELAVVVVRPELVDCFRQQVPDRPSVLLDIADRADREPERLLLAAIDAHWPSIRRPPAAG